MTSQRIKIKNSDYWLDAPPLPTKFKNLTNVLFVCFGYFIRVMSLRCNPHFGNESFICSAAHSFHHSDIVYTFLLFFFFSQSLFPQHIYFFKRNIYLVWANLLHSGVSKARLATKLLLSLSSLPWSRHLGQLLIQLCFLLFPLLNMFSSLPSEWKLWLFLCILALSFTSLLLQLFSEY